MKTRSYSINMRTAKRLMICYASLLSLLTVFLTFRPVMAQNDTTVVGKGEKECHGYFFDRNECDSSFSYFHHFSHPPFPGVDSLMDDIFGSLPPQYFGDFMIPRPPMPDIPDHFFFRHFPDSIPGSGHPFGFFYHNNGPDSTGVYQPFPPDTSLNQHFYSWKFDDMWENFEDHFEPGDVYPDKEFFRRHYEQQQRFHEKYGEYLKERRKLIEKYFGEPDDMPEAAPPPLPNSLPAPGHEQYEPKKGKI